MLCILTGLDNRQGDSETCGGLLEVPQGTAKLVTVRSNCRWPFLTFLVQTASLHHVQTLPVIFLCWHVYMQGMPE